MCRFKSGASSVHTSASLAQHPFEIVHSGMGGGLYGPSAFFREVAKAPPQAHQMIDQNLSTLGR